ncbi:lysine-specific demethylase rbr-2 [Dorcoceras hygrometricum]|uniref:Lysine-specific demethylase rbr-2 n=1 Tax=Dorcoceras hygrometricum TaxID=472368 RepID=A0A2Z7APP3_9LAMI|nr:lysine-specific demethylase rbr-2 [Dorcoceras hygrometricum]
MASPLFTNTLQVCFDSVLAMDNPGMVVSTIRGKKVEISEELFASTFEFPVDGLTYLSEIPKDIVFDARSIFSLSGEQVRYGDCGIKAGKGYAIQISLLLENVPNLELGDSSEFPSSRILTKKTVHRYIAVNDKVGVEEVANVPRVKRTPVTKAVSRKRPAAVDEPIVKKKRTRVGKAVVVATDSALEAVPVQVVATISTVPPPAPKHKIQKRKRRLALGSDDEIVGEPTTVAVEVAIENIVEEQRVEMPVDPVDQIIEQVIAETAQVETDVGRTNDSGPDVEDQGVKTADETDLWFNLSYKEFHARQSESMVESSSDTEEEFVTEKVTVTDVGVKTETGSDVYLVEKPSEQTELFQGTETATAAPTADKNISDDESMTLETILCNISDDLSLPSTFGEITPIQFGKSISIPGVDEGDWYKTSLPKINHVDKGKAPLQERDPVKGNPVKEQFLLILADIDLLVQLREKVIDEVEQFLNSFSLKKLAVLKIADFYAKE